MAVKLMNCLSCIVGGYKRVAVPIVPVVYSKLHTAVTRKKPTVATTGKMTYPRQTLKFFPSEEIRTNQNGHNPRSNSKNARMGTRIYFCLPSTKGSPSSGFRLSGAYNLTAATRPVSSKLPKPTLPHSKVLSTARMIGFSKSFTKTSIFPVECSRTKRKSCHSRLLQLCPCVVLCEILVLGLPFTTKQL